MAKKINHLGRGGNRELLFSLCSLWFFPKPISEYNKKSLDPVFRNMAGLCRCASGRVTQI